MLEIMAPSSLKKMSGSRRRKEGNYASSDIPPSLARFTSDDLGLTLLPGSQIQKEEEGTSETAAISNLRRNRNTKGRGYSQAYLVEYKRQCKTAARRLPLDEVKNGHSNLKVTESSARSHSDDESWNLNVRCALQKRPSSIWVNDDIHCGGFTTVGETSTENTQKDLQYNGSDEVQANRYGDDLFQPKKRRKIKKQSTDKAPPKVISEREAEGNETDFDTRYSGGCCNKSVKRSGNCEDSSEAMPTYIFNESQKDKSVEPSVQASPSAMPGGLTSRKASTQNDASKESSMNVIQRLEHQRRHSVSSLQSRVSRGVLSAISSSSTDHHSAARRPAAAQGTRNPPSTTHRHLHRTEARPFQRTKEFVPAAASKFSDPRRKVLKPVKRSWTSHFPRRYNGPLVSGRCASPPDFCSTTPLLSNGVKHNTEPLIDCLTATAEHDDVDLVSSSLSPTSFHNIAQPVPKAKFRCGAFHLDDTFDDTLAKPQVDASRNRATSLPNSHSLYYPPDMKMANTYQPAVVSTPPNRGQAHEYRHSRPNLLSRQDITISSRLNNTHESVNDFAEQVHQQLGHAYPSQTAKEISRSSAAAVDRHIPGHRRIAPGRSNQTCISNDTAASNGSSSSQIPFNILSLRRKRTYTHQEFRETISELQRRHQAELNKKEKNWGQREIGLLERLCYYEPHNLDQCHNAYQDTLEYTRGKLIEAEQEISKLRQQRDLAMQQLAAKPRSIEERINNISKAYSSTAPHESGVGNGQPSNQISIDLTADSPRANFSSIQGPQAPAQHPPAQQPMINQFLCHNMPAQHQHLSIARRFPTPPSPAQHPPAPYYSAPQAAAQRSQAEQRIPWPPQGQLAPAQQLLFVAPQCAADYLPASCTPGHPRLGTPEEVRGTPAHNVQAERAPAGQVRNHDVQAEQAPLELVQNHDVQAQPATAEEMQTHHVQAGQQKLDYVQNEALRAQGLSREQIRHQTVQAVQRPVGQTANQAVRAQEAQPGQIYSHQHPQRVDVVISSSQSAVEEQTRTPEGVQEEAWSRFNQKELPWYDGIHPGTMVPVNKKPFGLPSATAPMMHKDHHLSQPMASDGSIAPLPNKAARTTKAKAPKKPKDTPDKAARAEKVSSERKAQALARKNIRERKKAQLRSKQNAQASAASTTSSPHSQRTLEENLHPACNGDSQSPPAQNGDVIWSDFLRDSEEEEMRDAMLAAEFEEQLMAEWGPEEEVVTQQNTTIVEDGAGDQEDEEREESEESEESEEE